MKYKVELRDSKGRLYKDNKGYIVTSNDISFDDGEENESLIHLICEGTSQNYEAIAKEGTDITIEVSDFNSISGTWMVLYSYYHNEKRFVKH